MGTLLNEKTTALLAIIVTVCATVVMAIFALKGSLTVDGFEKILGGILPYVMGGPIAASGLNKLYGSTPKP